jgi:hypothetical protein
VTELRMPDGSGLMSSPVSSALISGDRDPDQRSVPTSNPAGWSGHEGKTGGCGDANHA